jgi:hypothetical protein
MMQADFGFRTAREPEAPEHSRCRYLLSFGKYQGLEILIYPNHIGNEDVIYMGCAPGKLYHKRVGCIAKNNNYRLREWVCYLIMPVPIFPYSKTWI